MALVGLYQGGEFRRERARGGGSKMSQKLNKSFRHKFSIRTARKNFQYRTPIRPFISSTFTDFMEERDYLMKKIFPTLDQRVKERGSSFAPVDLRWGIDAEQSKEGKVIQLCLDYINESAPYFICLLGDRYGSHRPTDLPNISRDALEEGNLQSVLEESSHWLDQNYIVGAQFHEWILQDGYQNLSITELEVLQSLDHNRHEHCYFYIRNNDNMQQLLKKDCWDAESESLMAKMMEETGETFYAQEKLLRLKRKIIDEGLPYKFFSSKEDLGNCILEDWNKVVDTIYPPLSDQVDTNGGDHYVEWAIQEAYAESKRRVFVQTKEIQKLHAQMSQFAEGCLEWNGHKALSNRLSGLSGNIVTLDTIDEPPDPGGENKSSNENLHHNNINNNNNNHSNNNNHNHDDEDDAGTNGVNDDDDDDVAAMMMTITTMLPKRKREYYF